MVGVFPALRRPLPTILQIEHAECGVACLAMVLAWHGRHIGLDELRIRAGVSRDGTKASNLLRAARWAGLEARGLRAEPDQLRDIEGPTILHWEFNHFVVLERVTGGFATIVDPAEGRRTISMRELAASFTGVALTFRQGERFRPGGRRMSPLSSLGERLRGTRPALFSILAASLFLVVPGVVLPVLSRSFIDDILIGAQKDWFLPFCLLLFSVILFQAAVTLFQQFLLMKLETRLAFLPTTRQLWHMLRLPISFYTQRHAGELASRLDANERLANLLSGELATHVFNLASIVAYAAIMLALDPVLAALLIAIQSVYALVLREAIRRQGINARQQVAAAGKLVAATIGPIRSLETVKASGLESEAFRRWAGHQARLLGLRSDQGHIDAVLAAVPALMQALAGALVLGVGGLRIMDGAATPGTLIAFQALAMSFSAPIAGLLALAGQIQQVRADLERADDVMRAPALAAAAGARVPKDSVVEAEDLSFGYNPLDPPLIEGLSLVLRPGAWIAIVGGSGSGKTTAGRLLAGLLEPWGGSLKLGGVDLLAIPAARRAALCGYVDQDIFLFEGTVHDNLTLWNGAVSEGTITQALADAAVLDDILSRKGRLFAAVDENGGNFSGGQRQRLEIARALAGNPQILILDEATSALDTATEKKIGESLRRRGCSCIVIAHRIATVRDCDEIIVMKAGRVVERGNHAKLLALEGEYASLVRENAP